MHIIDEIKKWIELTIIELNLCPFAKEPYLNKALLINICEEIDEDLLVQDFLNQVEMIETDPKIETLIWALPMLKSNFIDFNDFSGLLDNILIKLNLQKKYQLVVFHPYFYFEGLDISDKANWVNRSPYPIIHLLKVDSLPLEDIEDAKNLSFINEDKIKKLSEEDLEKYFWYIIK